MQSTKTLDNYLGRYVTKKFRFYATAVYDAASPINEFPINHMLYGLIHPYFIENILERGMRGQRINKIDKLPLNIFEKNLIASEILKKKLGLDGLITFLNTSIDEINYALDYIFRPEASFFPREIIDEQVTKLIGSFVLGTSQSIEGYNKRTQPLMVKINAKWN